jgi:hypothetical protein
MEYEVVVELPAGSRNKREMDRAPGRIRLDRTPFTATRYPWKPPVRADGAGTAEAVRPAAAPRPLAEGPVRPR